VNTRQDPIHEDDLTMEGDIYIGEDGYVHEPDGSIAFCTAETYAEVRYLSNGDPGYPAEYCDNEATEIVEGFAYCAEHAYWEDGPDPDDERDRLADLQWERDNEPFFGEDY